MKLLKDELELLAVQAQRELEELEQRYADKAVAIINEMKERTGYGITMDFDTGIEGVDLVLEQFANEWDTLNFDLDLVADEVADEE